MTTWDDGSRPQYAALRGLDWVRVVRRGVPMIILILLGLLLTLALRLPERLMFGARRPLTQWITVFVCRNALRLMGLRLELRGKVSRDGGAVVANHSSWLDIFVLNASKPIYFVSKAEVASWPGIGWLARATGTVFIERNPKRARQQTELFQSRLNLGHRLLFFPEGTSTDGRRVLPFKTTLFAAFFAKELQSKMSVQPVSVLYQAPAGQDPRFYGWWGDMGFGGHLIQILAAPQHGNVTVLYHKPLRVSDFAERKALAAACGTLVSDGFNEGVITASR